MIQEIFDSVTSSNKFSNCLQKVTYIRIRMSINFSNHIGYFLLLLDTSIATAYLGRMLVHVLPIHYAWKYS